jgi:putative Holliday junction resolvase
MSGMRDAARAAPPISADGTILAFDFGTKKIGVALGNTISGTARPLLTVRDASAAGRWEAIANIITEWQPVLLVVGRPLHADGTEHDVTVLADRFARDLALRFALPVQQVDERYTTQAAQTTRASGEKRRGTDPGRDAVAAQIILQAWLDQRGAAAT